MKRIVIHAGPGKTGSSAIQRWLNTNADGLEAQGFLYPRHAVDPNGVSSGNRDEVMQLEENGRFVVSPTKVAGLLSAFQSSHCHTLLLSSEHFFGAIRAIRRSIPDALFVVYLRDPIEVAESAYNQAVKRAGCTDAFVLPCPFQDRVLLRLDEMLRLVKPPRLLIRPYGEELFVGGSIVSDLCEAVGINADVGVLERVNPSYTFEALEFKRHANHFPLGDLAEPLDRALQACPVGEREYSFIPDTRYAEVRAEVIVQLRELADRHGLASLHALIHHLEDGRRRPFRPQQARAKQLAAVAEYLRSTAPDVFDGLVRCVRAGPATALPSDAFVEILDPQPAN